MSTQHYSLERAIDQANAQLVISALQMVLVQTIVVLTAFALLKMIPAIIIALVFGAATRVVWVALCVDHNARIIWSDLSWRESLVTHAVIRRPEESDDTLRGVIEARLREIDESNPVDELVPGLLRGLLSGLGGTAAWLSGQVVLIAVVGWAGVALQPLISEVVEYVLTRIG